MTAAYNIARLINSLPNPGGRLSLATGVPVMTTTQSAKTTIFYTPYISRLISLYDGTRFINYDFGAELSQTTTDTTKSPAAVTTNSNYDLFVWLDGTTFRCTRGPLWTSDTARGTGAGTTELEQVQGIYVNKVAITNGPAAQRGTYVGTVRSNGSSQIDYILGAAAAGGTAGFLGVWNCYNRRVSISMTTNTTDSWTYGPASWRAPNGSATMRCSFVIGIAEDGIMATYTTMGRTTGTDISAGIGYDSTSTSTGIVGYGYLVGDGALNVTGIATIYPAIGFHYVSALEMVITGNTNFYGDGGQTGLQSGLTTKLMM